jgi:hypothetical protein
MMTSLFEERGEHLTRLSPPRRGGTEKHQTTKNPYHECRDFKLQTLGDRRPKNTARRCRQSSGERKWEADHRAAPATSQKQHSPGSGRATKRRRGGGGGVIEILAHPCPETGTPREEEEEESPPETRSEEEGDRRPKATPTHVGPETTTATTRTRRPLAPIQIHIRSSRTTPPNPTRTTPTTGTQSACSDPRDGQRGEGEYVLTRMGPTLTPSLCRHTRAHTRTPLLLLRRERETKTTRPLGRCLPATTTVTPSSTTTTTTTTTTTARMTPMHLRYPRLHRHRHRRREAEGTSSSAG